MTVTALNTQTVGQSLTLQCEVTAVRGITSRVDIMWSNDDGTILRTTNDVSSTTMDNSLVYTDSYTISQLSITDEGRVIQCEVVINASPSVMANITLDVTGEYKSTIMLLRYAAKKVMLCSAVLQLHDMYSKLLRKPTETH